MQCHNINLTSTLTGLSNTMCKILPVQVGLFSDHLFTSVHRAVTVLPLKPVLHDMVTSSRKL